ncbi:MAG: SGNH/GDSL hydrolase family protein [Microcoleaceae cyanobacterium]
MGIVLFSATTHLLASTSTTSAVPIPLQGKQKIVILGDSITKAGSQHGGYIWLVQNYLSILYPEEKFDLKGAGISGEKSTDLLSRFQTDVLNENPNLVIIQVGVNDALQRTGNSNANPKADIDRYSQTLSQMVTLAQVDQVSVLLLSPILASEDFTTQENQRLKQYIAAMQKVATENRCQFINLNVPFYRVITTYQQYAGQGQNILTRDGIHPNIAGHQVIAYTLLKGWGVPEQQIKTLRPNR